MLCNLITIDDEYSTTHFTHHSVLQHLLSACTNLVLGRYHFDIELADAEFGHVCVTYLNIEGVAEQRAIPPPPRTDVTDYAAKIVKQTLPKDQVSPVALKLLRRKRKFRVTVQLSMDIIHGQSTAPERQLGQRDFALLPYVDAYWLLHTKKIKPEDGAIWEFWIDLVVTGDYNTDP